MKNKLDLTKIQSSAKEVLLIVKKELITNFTSPTAYIVMAVFLAILEFLYFSSLMSIQLVYIKPLLDYIPWLFLFLIPAITMSSIAQEMKEGTIEFYLTQPISEIQLLIGKFLANYIFVIISTLLTLPVIFSVASYGNVDWGQITAQYLGVFALAFVLTAIGTFMSAITKNQISAFLLSVLTSFALTIIGLEVVTQSLPVVIAQIFERIGLYSHYQALSGGALDFRDIIYFISIGSIFLIASYLPLVKNKFHPTEPIYRTIKAVIILLSSLALSIAFLGEQIPGRIDLTENKLYTLSDTTKNILTNATDIISITVYTSKNLPSQWQPQKRDVEEMLRDYDTYGKENVNVNYKYTDNEDIETEALSAGIQAVQFNTQSSDEISVQKGYLGIEIAYLDKTEVISFVENTDDLEYQLTKRINKLTTKDKPLVTFWEGSSLHSIYEDYSYFVEVLGDQFEITNFSYDTESSTTLPEGTKTLVIMGPNVEFSQEEKDLITNFINNGGSILALIDPVTIDQTTLSADVNEYSLADLFTTYGLEFQDELIYDLQYGEIVSVGSGTSQYLARYPFWIQAITSEDSALTEGIDMVSLRWASPLNIADNLGENVTITPLIYSSSYSATQKSDSFDVYLDAEFDPSAEDLYSRYIAVSYEKTLEDNLTSRIIAVGDSDLLNNDTLANSSTEAMFGLNSIEWLTQSTSLNEIRQKNRELSSLIFEKDWEATVLQYGNMVGIIVILTATGIIITTKRRQKSKRTFK